jgi:hypothetical protein
VEKQRRAGARALLRLEDATRATPILAWDLPGPPRGHLRLLSVLCVVVHVTKYYYCYCPSLVLLFHGHDDLNFALFLVVSQNTTVSPAFTLYRVPIRDFNSTAKLSTAVELAALGFRCSLACLVSRCLSLHLSLRSAPDSHTLAQSAPTHTHTLSLSLSLSVCLSLCLSVSLSLFLSLGSG